MKKYIRLILPLCLVLLLALVFSLWTVIFNPGSDAQTKPSNSPFANLSPNEKAEKFLKEADGIYYEIGSYELYGETVQILVSTVDGDGRNSLFPTLTDALDKLKTVDLSNYEEPEELDEEGMGFFTFYTGIGDARCQITLGLEPTMTDMTIHFLFDDGDEYVVAGPYSQDLLSAGDASRDSLTNADETDGNIRRTILTEEGNEPRILLRGPSTIIQRTFELTMEKTAPLQEPADSTFDILLEVIGGKTYRYDSEHMRFNVDGTEQIFAIECDEDLAEVLKIPLRK